MTHHRYLLQKVFYLVRKLIFPLYLVILIKKIAKFRLISIFDICTALLVTFFIVFLGSSYKYVDISKTINVLWSWAFWNAKRTSKIFYKNMPCFLDRKKITVWFLEKKPSFFTPKFCILTSYSGNMNLGLPLKTVSNTVTYGRSKKPSLKTNGFTDFLEMSFEVGQIGQVQDRSVIWVLL